MQSSDPTYVPVAPLAPLDALELDAGINLGIGGGGAGGGGAAKPALSDVTARGNLTSKAICAFQSVVAPSATAPPRQRHRPLPVS